MIVKKGIVYALYGRNQNDILYIGSTCNMYARYYQHLRCFDKNHEPIYKHLKAHGYGINMTTIEEFHNIQIKELRREEEYWIDQFRQWGFPIKNITDNISYKKPKKQRPLSTPIITEDYIDELKEENDFFTFTDILNKSKVSKSTLFRFIRENMIREKHLGQRKLYSLTDVLNSKSSKK